MSANREAFVQFHRGGRKPSDGIQFPIANPVRNMNMEKMTTDENIWSYFHFDTKQN